LTSSPQPVPEYSEGLRWQVAVLLTVLAVQLVSLWTVRFVPTQDGPVHQEIATQLGELRKGTGGVIVRYYELNSRPEPNWLVYPLLEALARDTGWAAAEKLILSLYLVALPLALAFALMAIRRDAAFLAILALPLAPNYLFHMGFLNFCLSVPLGLFALGYGLRLRVIDRPLRYGALAMLLLITSMAHAVSACAVAVVLCAVGAWRGAAAGEGRPARWAGAARGAAGPLAATAPALVLIASFLSGPSRHALSWESPIDLLRRLVCLHVMVSLDRMELGPAIALAALLAGMVALRLAGWRQRPFAGRGDDLLAAVAVLAGLYFTLPAGLAGGGYLNPRLELWLVLALLLWLAHGPWREAQRRAIVAVGAGLALVLIGMHALAYRRLSRELEEYVSVESAIPPQSTVLPLSFVDDPKRLRDPSLSGFKVRPFEHALAYLAVSRPLVNLAEYQADQGYFPIRYRDDVDPYRALVPEEGLVEDALDRIDWRAYERRGGRVDYVLLWGRAASNPWPGQEAFLARLGTDYEPVFSSRPRGLAELYRRRPPS
jgi:hypothetical protein